MVEDNPQDLVHDVAAEVVFGPHPLGRPVIGSAEVISSVSRRVAARVPRRRLRGRERRARGRGQRRPRAPRRLLRKRRRDGSVTPLRLARRPLRRVPAPRASLPAQGHRAVPRRPVRPRRLARRRPPLRGVAARRDRRRLGVVAPLPGDPGEARDGVQRLQLRRAVRGDRSGRHLHRHARGQPRRVPRRHRGRAPPTWGRATSAPGELERAKENLRGRLLLSLESTSNRMTRLGRAVITGVEIVTVEETIARIEAVTADDVAALAREVLAPECSRPRASAHGRSASATRSRASTRRRWPHEGLPVRRCRQGRDGARTGACARPATRWRTAGATARRLRRGGRLHAARCGRGDGRDVPRGGSSRS